MMELVGGEHAYQVVATILMAYGELINSLQCMQPILTASSQKYRCLGSTNSSSPLYSRPPGQLGNQTGDLFFGTCSIHNASSGDTFPCDSWEFDTSRFRSTINSRYSLTCGRDALGHASTSIYFFGHLLGCSLYGSFSDRYGRLKMILVSALNIAIFSTAAALASSPTSTSPFWLYVLLRLLTGIGVGGLFTISLTMEAEVTGARHRVLFFMATHVGSSLGAMLLSLLALWLRDHFWIQVGSCLTARPVCVRSIFPQI